MPRIKPGLNFKKKAFRPSVMKPWDAIDFFADSHDLGHLSKEELASLIKILEDKYPLEIRTIYKLRTKVEIPEHGRYMRLASVLYSAGYKKRGTWFTLEMHDKEPKIDR